VAKGYTRGWAANKLNGRVTRLLVSPLLIALKKGRGDRGTISITCAPFRYPLSANLPCVPISFPTCDPVRLGARDWRSVQRHGATLPRNQSVRSKSRTDYDHKHQDLSEADADRGPKPHVHRHLQSDLSPSWQRMARCFTPNVFRTLKATYYRCALDLLDALLQ